MSRKLGEIIDCPAAHSNGCCLMLFQRSIQLDHEIVLGIELGIGKYERLKAGMARGMKQLRNSAACRGERVRIRNNHGRLFAEHLAEHLRSFFKNVPSDFQGARVPSRG